MFVLGDDNFEKLEGLNEKAKWLSFEKKRKLELNFFLIFYLFNEWYDNPVSILLMNFDGLVYIIQGYYVLVKENTSLLGQTIFRPFVSAIFRWYLYLR
jgi:hypothetical protein